MRIRVPADDRGGLPRGRGHPALGNGARHDLLDVLLPEQGRPWAAAYDDVPTERRHLAIHDQHPIAINERDRAFVNGEVMAKAGVAPSWTDWREKLSKLEADGATEIAYQPAGPDAPRELETFADMMRG